MPDGGSDRHHDTRHHDACQSQPYRGQPLIAGLLTYSIYAAILIAAILRIASTVLPGAMIALLHAAGVAWIAAFWMITIGYGPLLSWPRRTAHQ